MTLSINDISYTLSGSNSNTDPDLSLGGDPSVQSIIGKRLFSDVIAANALSGIVDYRCIYLHNENNTDPVYSSVISVNYIVPGPVLIEIGFNFQDEIQSVTISNYSLISGGSFTLTYTDIAGTHNFTIPWNANVNTWASSFQTAIRIITNLEDVVVNPIVNGFDLIFQVFFVGTAEKRSHDILVLNNNSLIGATGINIVKTVNGAPINSVADQIDVATTAPVGITFATSAIVGIIRPYDAVPIWIKRIVPANSPALENDGFTLRLAGDPIP
jgi:hypothetical protein